jgi:hypothetical protein
MAKPRSLCGIHGIPQPRNWGWTLGENPVIRGDPGWSAKILTAAEAGWRFRPSGVLGDSGSKAMPGHGQVRSASGPPCN